MTTAIRTRYQGKQFRSKLEADWALAFDRLQLEWQYEAEGLQLEDVFYLPDFYLPRSRQYVEVKVLPTPEDVRKWQALVESLAKRPFTSLACPDIPLVICGPHGVFHGFRPGSRTFADFLIDGARPVGLLQCKVCRGWWFADPEEAFRCQCCGAYDGRKHLADLITSPADGWPRSIHQVV